MENLHTYLPRYLPIALAFFQGRFVVPGFANLGLSAPNFRALSLTELMCPLLD